MTRGIFGGDTSLGHYVCRLCDETYPFYSEKRRIASRALHLAFGRERYFSFKASNEKAKAKAKVRAEDFAKEVKAKTYITVTVREGCFL